MAATTRAEKPVRTGFDQQQGGAGAAALEAIDRLDQLLREEVIPRLPGEETQVEDELDGAAYDEEDETSAVALAAGGTLPCRKGGPTPADKAVVKKIGPKLRGKLRGHLTADRICCARADRRSRQSSAPAQARGGDRGDHHDRRSVASQR